jgi:hypothetical protein
MGRNYFEDLDVFLYGEVTLKSLSELRQDAIDWIQPAYNM